MRRKLFIIVLVKFWWLSYLVARIRQMESDSIEKDGSIEELISGERKSEAKVELEEARRHLILQERDRLRKLRAQARRLYEELQQSEMGAQLLRNRRLALESLDETECKDHSEKGGEIVLGTAKWAWKIVGVGIVLSLLSFASAAVLRRVGVYAGGAIEKVGLVFLIVAVAAFIVNSAMIVVAQYIENKRMGKWAFVKTVFYEVILIALSMLLFCAIMGALISR